MKLRVAFFCFVLAPLSLFYGQDKSEIIQQRIEFISERFQSENIDLTNIIEQLDFYFEHPINLNYTDGVELEELGLLTTVQISDLVLHRKLFGKFISIYELQSLSYWDIETIQLVRPFVKVDDKLDNIHITLKEALEQGKYEVF